MVVTFSFPLAVREVSDFFTSPDGFTFTQYHFAKGGKLVEGNTVAAANT